MQEQWREGALLQRTHLPREQGTGREGGRDIRPNTRLCIFLFQVLFSQWFLLQD